MRISVVIPCYNEEKIIKKTMDDLVNFFEKNKKKIFDYELIFVDDGSTDETFNILTENHLNRKIVVISYYDNHGKGDAVRSGLIKTKFDTILILDADLSVKPDEIMKNIFTIKTARKPLMIIGKRIQVVKQPLHRILAGFCYRWLVKIMFQWKYDDTQCCYKVLVNIPEDIFYSLSTKGFSYDVELIKAIRDARYPIVQQEVKYYNNDDSKVTLKKTIKMFFELLRIRF